MDDALLNISEKLKQALDPLEIKLIDNSWRHAGHLEARPGLSATHLEILLISPQFREMSRLDRHRWIHRILKEEMQTHLHALELAIYTPEEWAQKA